MDISRKLTRKIVPQPLRSALRQAVYEPVATAVGLALGRESAMIPPTALMHDGPADVETFRQNGRDYLRYYIELGGLKPDERVLDVGCGIGRKTIPLTHYLNRRARYEGFDIVQTGVDWCRARIGLRYRNFHFQRVDVYNQWYNPQGRLRAEDFRFPFPNASFDFAVAASVFTHMLPQDMEHYLCEAVRVLAPGGRCLFTFFLLNDESVPLIETGRSTLDFKYLEDRYRVVNANAPEQTVAYDEGYIRELYQRHGLTILPPLHYGSWCGRANALDYQDIILTVKDA
jgi:SAM-dependent methyltransferase